MENNEFKANYILDEIIKENLKQKTIIVQTEHIKINKIEWLESRIDFSKLSTPMLFSGNKQPFNYIGNMRIMKVVNDYLRSDNIEFYGKGLISYSISDNVFLITDLEEVFFGR